MTEAHDAVDTLLMEKEETCWLNKLLSPYTTIISVTYPIDSQ